MVERAVVDGGGDGFTENDGGAVDGDCVVDGGPEVDGSPGSVTVGTVPPAVPASSSSVPHATSTTRIERARTSRRMSV
jgi:hypothetical protein